MGVQIPPFAEIFTLIVGFMNLQTKTKDISSVEKQVFIEIPQSYFDDEFENKIKDCSKKVQLKGFRKGKVPKRVILEKFSESLKGEALEKVVHTSIDEACKKEKIQPIAIKDVKDLLFENVDPITLNVAVEIDQDVEIENYKNLGIKIKKAQEASSADIEKELNNYAKSMAEEKEVTTKAEKGHLVIGVYTEIQLDGEKQEISKPEFRIEIGVQKIKEFDDALIGVTVDKEVKVKFKYSKDYEIESFRNKKAIYILKVKAIKELILPELNDEMAKKMGVESLDKLRESIQKHLQNTKEQKSLQSSQDEVIRKILDHNQFDLPQARISHYMKMQLQSNQKQEMTDDDLDRLPKVQKKALESEAIFALKRYKILQNIAQKEKIKVTQVEVDENIKQMATQWNMPFEKIKNSLRQNGRVNEIREELKMKNTLNFLLDIKEGE